MGKRKKPHPDFPLHIHKTGRWAKKVLGKRVYFGYVADDPDGQAAIAKWNEQKDDLLAGRKPRDKSDAVTVADLCNHFIAFKEAMRDSGEITARTFKQYFDICDLLVAQLGKRRPVSDLRADDFLELRALLAKQNGSTALGNRIQDVRSVFRYGKAAGLLTEEAQFGPAFRKPSAKTMRLERAARGPRMFEPRQVLALLKVASVNMRAMILLGLNGALGNSDLGAVTIAAFDLRKGWLVFPRVKTGIARRIPLWKETIAAVKDTIKNRPEPADKLFADLLFLTVNGLPYVPDGDTSWRISDEFALTAKRAKVKGRQFYDLRRSFQTVADESRDVAATSAIMGHVAASGDMSSVYRQRIDDSRLKAVVDHVRAWLFSTAKAAMHK